MSYQSEIGWLHGCDLLLGSASKQLLLREQNWSSDFTARSHPRFVDLRSMASPAAVPKPRRRRGKVVLQDVDLLKSQRQKLKQDLKEMIRNLKLQLQKKRRIMLQT